MSLSEYPRLTELSEEASNRPGDKFRGDRNFPARITAGQWLEATVERLETAGVKLLISHEKYLGLLRPARVVLEDR